MTEFFDAPILSTRPAKATTRPPTRQMLLALKKIGREWAQIKGVSRMTLWSMENRGLVERRYVETSRGRRPEWRLL